MNADLPDYVADHPVLSAFVAVLVLLLLFVLAVWLKRRRSAAARPPAPPPRAPLPDSPAPLPALSIDSFAPLPPRAASPRPARPTPTAAPRPVPRPAAPSAPASVLVVDDSGVSRALLRKLFGGAGFMVDVAADGDEALALIDSQRYAVLVTDLEMPKVNGFELIAAVQASPDNSDLPIVAITGHDELSARVQDMKGLYGIFKKPWNDNELLQRVVNLATMRQPAAHS